MSGGLPHLYLPAFLRPLLFRRSPPPLLHDVLPVHVRPIKFPHRFWAFCHFRFEWVFGVEAGLVSSDVVLDVAVAVVFLEVKAWPIAAQEFYAIPHRNIDKINAAAEALLQRDRFDGAMDDTDEEDQDTVRRMVER